VLCVYLLVLLYPVAIDECWPDSRADQHLDHAQQLAVAKCLGTPTIAHPVFGMGGDGGFPEVYSVSKYRAANSKKGALKDKPQLRTPPRRDWDGWHSDITSAVNPPKVSVLRGVVVPPPELGQTAWCDLTRAHGDLPLDMQRRLARLRGRHEGRSEIAIENDRCV